MTLEATFVTATIDLLRRVSRKLGRRTAAPASIRRFREIGAAAVMARFAV